MVVAIAAPLSREMPPSIRESQDRGDAQRLSGSRPKDTWGGVRRDCFPVCVTVVGQLGRRRNSRIAASKPESSHESGPTYVTRRPVVSEIEHRKPVSNVEALPVAFGLVSLLAASTRTSWRTNQPLYTATAVAVEITEKSSHTSPSEVWKLSASAARRFTISAAIMTARCRLIALRRLTPRARFCRIQDKATYPGARGANYFIIAARPLAFMARAATGRDRGRADLALSARDCSRPATRFVASDESRRAARISARWRRRPVVLMPMATRSLLCPSRWASCSVRSRHRQRGSRAADMWS